MTNNYYEGDNPDIDDIGCGGHVIPMLKTIICILTTVTGLFSLLWPNATVAFTGLQPLGGRGISEIRAVLGGLFVVLGLAPIILRGETFRMLGWAYLGIAIVRGISIVIDQSSVRSNWISLAVEVVFGIVLVL